MISMRLKRYSKGLALLLFSYLTGSAQLLADNVRIVVGLALPPYVIADQDKGLELDIVRESFQLAGHSITPVYVPFWRVPAMLQSNQADAAMTINEGSGLQQIFYSDSHIYYQNVVIALEERDLDIQNIADMQQHSVLAFQTATNYLGKAFADMAAENMLYQETARQSSQISMLFSQRIDTVVMDINIFNYYRRTEFRLDTSPDIRIYPLFPKAFYKVGFRSQKLRDDFNQGLKQLKQSGRHRAIYQQYEVLFVPENHPLQ